MSSPTSHHSPCACSGHGVNPASPLTGEFDAESPFAPVGATGESSTYSSSQEFEAGDGFTTTTNLGSVSPSPTTTADLWLPGAEQLANPTLAESTYLASAGPFIFHISGNVTIYNVQRHRPRPNHEDPGFQTETDQEEWHLEHHHGEHGGDETPVAPGEFLLWEKARRRRAPGQEREVGRPWGGTAPPSTGLTGLGSRATLALAGGERNENTLTDLVFFDRHPERGGRSIQANEPDLASEWLQIRDTLVRPALGTVTPSPTRPPAPSSPGSITRDDTWVRTVWADYHCKPELMVRTRCLSNDVEVNSKTVGAFTRLAETLLSTGYRATWTGGYNCRSVKDGTAPSLHSYGLAIDIDPACNPFLKPRAGPVRFSPRQTQSERCEDVKAGRADTSFTPAQIAAVEAIKTVDGLQVFEWGGRWNSLKDGMHFQIDVSPGELARGLAYKDAP